MKAHASALTGSPDETVANAAHDVLTALQPAAELFPALTSDKAGTDASILYAAAGRIRFTILKVD